MKNRRKSLRASLFSGLTVLVIVVVLALNFLLAFIGIDKGAYIDLTTEGLYTLTDAMIRECSFLDDMPEEAEDVRIIFCADPDVLLTTEYTRATYLMALQLQERFDNVKVEEVNVVYNPTAVAEFKPTSLSAIEPGDIIISYGGRFRIQKPISFWGGSDNAITSYNGEFVMASCLLSVTSTIQPTAYLVKGHGETYYVPGDEESSNDGEALYNLLVSRGLTVKTLDIEEAGEIPDDCVLLVINNPREDFLIDPNKLSDINYRSEIELMDRYMVNRQGSIIVARDHRLDENGKSRHPALDAFLHEWGFDFTDTTVVDDDNKVFPDGPDAIIYGEYSTDKDSIGALVYSSYASLPSAAKVVFDDAGYIKTSFVAGGGYYEAGNSAERLFMSFMDSYSTALANDVNGGTVASGNLTLAALTGRYYLDSYSNVATRSNLFCVNSKSFLSDDVLGNYSYANHEIMSLLLEQMLFSDRYASMELGGTSMNSENYGGKMLDSTLLSVTSKAMAEVKLFPVVLFAIPVASLVLGIVIYTKRKYL